MASLDVLEFASSVSSATRSIEPTVKLPNMSFAMCCEKIQRRPVLDLRGTRQNRNRNEVANATSEIVWLGRSGVRRH